ncbi:hypothetical protein BLL42_11285 [Pseudomonas frederiksbergensis]|uniref:Putative tail fiber protein gp53-like C-terminal domain-containing protein n=1 Tax=Pseudomonas frederiksbergensis TaxID=104087 RepID=A0A1J0EJP7_9PSED|nr:hypothetical protein [Pseudomonas frederiksbergensis]APC16281.1 hypothetical protein BLL42_11285 [Pseudomonas frederiksbergensis]
MQKIGDSTNTANAAGEYTEGSPGAGVSPTLIKAGWLNAIQRELVNLVNGAGIPLNPADDLQVFKAVKALAGAAYVQATELLHGVTKIATKEQVAAGTDDSTTVTPKKLAKALADLWRQATESLYGVTKIATEEQVAAGANDSTTVTPKKLAKALADLWRQATESLYGVTKIATEEQVAAGANDSTTVTPKKLAKALADLWQQATEARFGVVRLASQAGVNAGIDDASAVTPKTLRWGFLVSLSPNGYIVFPTWLFGWTLQWGTAVTVPSGSSSTTSFPIAFPNACFKPLLTLNAAANLSSNYSGGVSWAREKLHIFHYSDSGSSATYNYWAVGY